MQVLELKCIIIFITENDLTYDCPSTISSFYQVQCKQPSVRYDYGASNLFWRSKVSKKI